MESHLMKCGDINTKVVEFKCDHGSILFGSVTHRVL